jgi:hypothetical protein
MNPDATALIGTLIAIYAVFLTVFSSQVPEALKARWTMSFFVLIAAVLAGGLIDFLRILNSLDDLTSATLRQLPAAKVQDAGDEARQYWFPINFGLVLIALLARTRLDRSGDADRATDR